MDHYIESIFKQMLHLNDIQQGESKQSRIAILLTHHFIGYADGLYTIGQLAEMNVQFDLFIDEKVVRQQQDAYRLHMQGISKYTHIQCKPIEQLIHIDRYSLVVIPVLPQSELVKISTFDQTHYFSELILRFLFKQTTLFVLEEATNLNSGAWRTSMYRPPNAMQKTIESYMQQVKQFGMQFFELNTLLHKIKTFQLEAITKKKVICEADIHYLHARKQSTLVIDSHTILTPLAKDAIRHLKINVITESGHVHDTR